MKQIHIPISRPLGAAVLFILTFTTGIYAQRTPLTIWALPGVSFQLSPRISVLNQLGFNTYQHSCISYTQAFYKASDKTVFGAGYLFYYAPVKGKSAYLEHDIVTTFTYIMRLGKFILEDRNMLLNTFSKISDGHYYRNRLKIFSPRCVEYPDLRFYYYNEQYWAISDPEWLRQRNALGVNCNISRRCDLDIAFLNQHDKYHGSSRLLLTTLTVKIGPN